MRAVVVREFGPPERAILADVPSPVPGPGELLLAVDVADVNYPDLLMIDGRYQVKPSLPFVPGKVAAGRVLSLSEGVAGRRVGDRVLAFVEHGAFAEQVAAPAASGYPIPPGVPPDAAAALGMAYQTAHFALRQRARLVAGESVLVLGAGGGVGLASVALAKAFGASPVIGATRGSAKAEAVSAAGADHVIDVELEDLREGLRRAVLDATSGRGADVVIDPVGGDIHAAAIRAVAWEGRLVVIGFAGGGIPTIRANYLLLKNITALGLQFSDYRDRRPDLCAAAQAEIFALYEAGQLRPEVSQVFPLAEFAEPLGLLAEGRARGKLLLDARA